MVSSLTLTLFMEQKPLTGAAEASDLSMETHLKSAQGPVYGADESQSAKVFIHPYIQLTTRTTEDAIPESTRIP